MRNSEAAIIVTGIIATVIIIVCMCGLGTVLIQDSNDLEWRPVPGTTEYGWR